MALLMIAIIILLIGVIMVVQSKKKVEKAQGVIKTAGFICIVVAAVFVVLSMIKTVPTGHTGVVVTFGEVQDYTYEAGVHFNAPWVTVVKMDNRTQKETIELMCFSSDIQEVSVTYTVNYQINKENAQTIYRTIGTEYFDIVVSPKISEAVKDVFAKYSAESLIESRASVSKQIQDILIEAVSEYNIEIVSASIENIDFTDSFTNAVEEKQVAEQNKLKAQTEQEQKTLEAAAEAERKVIAAQADSDTAIIAAQADAEVAKIAADSAEYQGQKDAAIMSNLGEMLLKYPELIDYYYTQNWNGELPDTYVSNDTLPVLNLN